MISFLEHFFLKGEGGIKGGAYTLNHSQPFQNIKVNFISLWGFVLLI